MPGKRGKQSVKKGIWYIGTKRKIRKRQRGKGFPLGLLASIGAPILGEVAKPILGKIFGRGRRRQKNGQKTHNFEKKSESKNS